jgi:membrane-associated protein
MQFLHWIRHLDDQIGGLIHNYGPWAYAILFLILFCETGLVIMPFLPGDTLLFAAGIFANQPAGKAGFNIWILLTVLTLAPLCGDTVNYFLGRKLGPRIFRNPNSKFLNPTNLQKTQEFFEKHGGKAVIIARWIPIIRTFAPFVAGMGAMTYKKFVGYSVLGAFLWVWICVGAGYFFGGIPWVKANFELAMIAMFLVTALPVLFETWKHRQQARRAAEITAEVATAEIGRAD